MKKIYATLWIFIVTIALNGCKDLIQGYDVDPVNITDPSVIDIKQYISGAEVNLIGAFEGDINRMTGMWTGHFSGEDRQYVPLSNYVVAARDFNNEWATMYTNVLANLKIIKEKARTVNNPRAIGIAQVMEAMTLGLAADLFGDVPYSQALQYPEIATPVYDPQLEVYQNVQRILDSAITNLALPVAASANPGSADIFFNGNGTQWTKVANTLKARYYLHVRDYANAVKYSDPTIAIASQADNMMAPHGNDYLQTFNLFYSFTTYDRSGYMGADSYAPTLLDPATDNNRNNAKTNEEARLWYYYLPGGGGNFGSIAYEPNVNSVDFFAPSPFPESATGFFGADNSFPLVTYEENLLIRAEAYAKQSSFNEALTTLNTLRAFYDAGGAVNPGYVNTDFSEAWGIVDDDENPIQLGLNYDPYTAADFASGGIENSANEAPLQALLREILEERYITLTGQLEVFNDVRRTGNFLGIPLKAGASQFPQRLPYPQSEINANAANVPSATLFTPTPVNATPY